MCLNYPVIDSQYPLQEQREWEMVFVVSSSILRPLKVLLLSDSNMVEEIMKVVFLTF